MTDINEETHSKPETPSHPRQPENWLSISEAAKYLRVSKDTLRRWERQKILKSYRSPTNHRYYQKEELNLVFNKRPDLEVVKAEAKPTETATKAARTREWQYPLTILLLVTYLVLMVFLAWLLLQNR